MPKSEPRPLEIGGKYMITWRNGNVVAGEIIETRPIKRIKTGGGNSSSSSNSNTKVSETEKLKPEDLEYYVHYPGYDRRLDEWVSIDRINLEVVVSASVGEDADASPRMKKKRKVDEFGDLESKEAQLAKLEREHDEITKVKNINSIVLGKYEIETWYYSPYPDEYCHEDRLIFVSIV